jgi:hypothetical protein
LAAVTQGLGGRQLKVVRPEGLHLTLVFLGEREEAEARAVGDLLDAAELAVCCVEAAWSVGAGSLEGAREESAGSSAPAAPAVASETPGIAGTGAETGSAAARACPGAATA